MLISRSAERLAAAAESIHRSGGSTVWAVADVRDDAAVRSALARCRDELGPIDIVLSGAAGNFVAPVAQVSSNGFRTVVDIDLLGTYTPRGSARPPATHPPRPRPAPLLPASATPPAALPRWSRTTPAGSAHAGTPTAARPPPAPRPASPPPPARPTP